MSANNYTQEQILSGIRIVWREVLDYNSPIHPDMSFFEGFKAGGFFADIDLYDVFFRLESVFGFSCSIEEWDAFVGASVQDPDEWTRTIAPQLTFGALADFIRERLKPISFGAITILGKHCLTAGVFRALEQLAGQVHPKVTRFAPSTPIRTRLRGFRLCRFWARLRWMLEDQLPPPPQIAFPSWGFLKPLLVKLGVGLSIALMRGDWKGLLEGSAVTIVLFLPVSVITGYINERLNPLPKEIETFGDLARVLAAIIRDQQAEAAAGSPAA